MKYELIYYKYFINGLEAWNLEQEIKFKTSENNSKNLKIGIIPTNAGYTELRENCILDFILKEISKL